VSQTAGPGDNQTQAVWREAREWWNGEPYRQFRRFTDQNGLRQVEEKLAPTLGKLSEGGPAAVKEDHSEDWHLQHGKIRDEKVAAACGALPPQYYEREEQERKGFVPIAPPPAKKGYVPLHCLSGYAYGRSLMLAEELANIVVSYEFPAAALVDPMSLTGSVEFVRTCQLSGVKPLVGTSVEVPEGGEIVLIAKTKRGYVSLSRLITACHLGEPRMFPLGSWDRLAEHSEDVICLTGGDVGPLDRMLVRRDDKAAHCLVERLVGIYGRDNVFLEVERSYLPWQMSVERRLLELAEATKTTCVAGGIVTQDRRDHFPAQDVLLCAESLCLIDDVIGRKARRDLTQPQVTQQPERSLNAERFLRSPHEMGELYADRPELFAETLKVADLCENEVLPERTRLPRMFEDDDHALYNIVFSRAHMIFRDGLKREYKARLKMEVRRIIKLKFATHFLVAWDMCRFAEEHEIGLSGRGSVIDSLVAYVLGFSRIDAVKHNLHFDRFLPEGGKRPDIDIDFEAKRRNDVRGYLVRKYGMDHVGAVAAIGSYRTRGIVRQVGKVFGLPDETIGFLAKRIHGGVPAHQLEAALEGRPELRNSNIPRERFRWVFELAERLMDVPTHIGLHSSGVVITANPLCDTVPVMGSASFNAPESGSDSPLRMIQWDKRSSKHFFDKFDILCLRGQDVLGGVQRRLRTSNIDFSASKSPIIDEPEVFRAMKSGELIGIPQSASPAMRQAHIRLQTDNLHEASLVQAGIRPGVGGAVKINELIARHRGQKYELAHPDLEKILGISYGIIVFQEQVDQLMQTFGGYTSEEAEDIREQIHKRRREDYGMTIRTKFLAKVQKKGYSLNVAEAVFEYVAGFKGYGFAQGHALAFAEVSLRSVWLMQNHPAEYFAALLSAQPAGYYGPCTIANEARSRGVQILPLDVTKSKELFEVEAAIDPVMGLTVPNSAVRIGLMQLRGLSAPTRDRILEAQSYGGAYGEAAEPALLPLQSAAYENRGGIITAQKMPDHSRFLDSQKTPHLSPFGSFFDFVVKVEPNRDELEALILAGGFDRLHPNRRALLWAVPQAMEYMRSLRPDGPNPCLPLDILEPKIDESIEDFSAVEKAVHERAYLDLDIEQHLMSYEREWVASKGGLTTSDARKMPFGSKVMCVGNPIRLRFPPTQSGKRVVFFDLEDETGLLNVTCFDDVYQRDGHAIVTSQYVTLIGTIQDRDGHAAFLTQRAFPYRPKLWSEKYKPLPIPVSDFLVG